MMRLAGAEPTESYVSTGFAGRSLEEIARDRFDQSISATEAFFEVEVDAISAAALEMARHFSRGGRLLVFGEGADATDAQHVSVEFLHPVVVGKRALPAVALTNDLATLTGGQGRPLAALLEALGRRGDIALGIAARQSRAMGEALGAAAQMGMLTISIEGGAKAYPGVVANHRFRLPGRDPLIAQEVGETLYHVLWELVHLFLEHGAGETEKSERQVAAT